VDAFVPVLSQAYDRLPDKLLMRESFFHFPPPLKS
jgi:hypothetical protein